MGTPGVLGTLGVLSWHSGCAGWAQQGVSRVSETPGEGGGELPLHGGTGGRAHSSWSRDTALPLLRC